jgi:hypothetical protein
MTSDRKTFKTAFDTYNVLGLSVKIDGAAYSFSTPDIRRDGVKTSSKIDTE